ncbi:MAG: alpha-2-macroglobulin family protein [Alphaproteobacteria bacterium]|nr:alpha-2-macroglobulin family protein [Alphaproteobacteria bacterium]
MSQKIFSVLVLLVSLSISEKCEASPSAKVHEFLNQQKLSIAKEYQEKLSHKKRPESSAIENLKRKVDAKRFYDQGYWYEATANLELIVALDPKDLQAWILLTLTRIQQEKQYASEPTAVLGAAYNAYKIAATPLDKALVLWLISQFDNKQAELRKEALKLAEQKDIEKRLAMLTSMYPDVFAPYDLEMPQRPDVGSLCVAWTRPLSRKRDLHYEDYVSVTPHVEDMSVIGKGNRLCIEGLAFGAQYKVEFKKGFPGEREAALTQTQTLEALIPHRKPTLNFRERGYILPSQGPQIIPLTAVNVKEVKLKIVHIDERNLVSQINRHQFLSSLHDWSFNYLKDEQGEVIWEGKFSIDGALDKATTKGLPIDQILGKNLKRGLYGIYAVSDNTTEEMYDFNQQATQWFVVSDIGITTFRGPDGLHILSRSITTGKPLHKTHIKVIARNNRELATIDTDQKGYAHIAEPAIAGEGGNHPSFIYASINGKEFTVLSLRDAAFDFSDRGVTGRAPTGSVDAFIYCDRGIYRPGEKINITGLLRSDKGKAATNMPLTFRILRPDGVEIYQKATKDQGSGSHTLEFSTSASSPSGEWTVVVHLDPKKPEIGRTTFRVRDFIPPRIEVSATPEQKQAGPLENYALTVAANYFFGPPAANLKVEGEASLVIAKTPFIKWPNYQFGLEEESWAPPKFKFDSARTDSKGKVELVTLVNIKPETTHILELESKATVYEMGGRGRTVEQKTSFWHLPYAIGIAPRFKDKTVSENSKPIFDIIAVDNNGKLKAVENLKYTLYQENHDYVWFKKGDEWNFEVVIRDHPVTTGKISTVSQAPAALQETVKFGRYRLEVIDDKTGVATSLRFSSGWWDAKDSPDRPDMLEVKLDKEHYIVGEKARVFIKPPFEGELIVTALGQRLGIIHTEKISSKGQTLDIPIKGILAENPGAYLIATVIRPADKATSKMPSRAIGVAWIGLEPKDQKLDLTLSTPKLVRPNTKLEVEVKLPHGQKGTYVTVAAIDESLLQLSDFKTPDPIRHFFSQQQLSYDIRDTYGKLINPYGVQSGSFQVGGDAGISQRILSLLAARSFKTVSLFSGVMPTHDKESIKIPFDLPDFTGRLRIMAIAWNEKAVGSTENQVVVRDNVEIDLSLPRFLAPQDQSLAIATIDNIAGQAGDYKVSLTVEGAIGLEQAFTQVITLKEQEQRQLPIRINALHDGIGKLHLHVEGRGNVKMTKSWDLTVRSAQPEIMKQTYAQLKPKETLEISPELLKDYISSRAKLQLSIGSVPNFGVSTLISQMKQYPYFCVEQLASRAIAFLYAEHPIKADSHSESLKTLKNIISQIIYLQRVDGSFALWDPTRVSEPWLTAYTCDVLTQIRKEGLEIPNLVYTKAINWLVQQSQKEPETPELLSLQAYTHYVLAKQGKGTLGRLRYFSDNNQNKLKSCKDAAFIAAAFAIFGDNNQAEKWFKKAIDQRSLVPKETNIYTSSVTDLAILVTMMAETTQNHPALLSLAQELADKSALKNYLSTQDKAWLIRGATALKDSQKAYKISLNNQKEYQGPASFELEKSGSNWDEKVVLNNLGNTSLSYTLTTMGQVVDTNKLKNNGFDITREVYMLGGEPVDLKNVKAGTLCMILLRGRLTEGEHHQVLVLDLLPAGFEIEDAKLTDENVTRDFAWLGNLTKADRLEGRDDRFFAAITLNKSNPDFKLAYIVRAVSSGKFIYPAPYVESMYRPNFFAVGEMNILGVTP